MDTPKLVIKTNKYTGESVVVSMRIPKDMLTDIDDIVKKTGRSRNEILMMSLEFAMNHMELE